MTTEVHRVLIVLGCALGCGVAGRPLARLGSRLSGKPLRGGAMAAACAAAGAGASAVISPSRPELLAVGLALALALTLLAAVDLAVWRLPDVVTIPLIGAGLLLAFVPIGPVGVGAPDRLIGAIAGFGALAGVGWLFRARTGRDGLGLGDAKLFAAAGAWLGWDVLPQVLVFACGVSFAWIACTVFARGLAAARQPIPFGPALCLSFLTIWLVKTA